MEKTIFERIIDRDVPAEILYEDDLVIAILNRFPHIPGETLVISKKPVAYIFDLDDAVYEHLQRIVKKIAIVLDKTFNALRTCVVVEGFDVPHVHVRLYPVTTNHFDPSPGPMASDEQLHEIATNIRAHL